MEKQSKGKLKVVKGKTYIVGGSTVIEAKTSGNAKALQKLVDNGHDVALHQHKKQVEK